jgi:hypothetical protein
MLAMLLGAAALAASIPRIASASPASPAKPGAPISTAAVALHESHVPPTLRAAPTRGAVLAQGLTQRDLTQRNLAQDDDDDSGDDATANKGASPDEIEKYVAVYRAMQRNHSMTVEQAAAANGLTMAAFRDLERRIESDDLARDDARHALAIPAEDVTPAAAPPKTQH